MAVYKDDKSSQVLFFSDGFKVYSEPRYGTDVRINTNPLGKNLQGEYFLVKEKLNGFCKGNFYDRPKGPDMWLNETELSQRSPLEVLFLFLVH